jgi:hypothetical protein
LLLNIYFKYMLGKVRQKLVFFKFRKIYLSKTSLFQQGLDKNFNLK